MKKIIVPIIFLSVGLSLLIIYYIYNPSYINKVINRNKITKTKEEYSPGVLIVKFKKTDLYSKNFKISIDSKTGIAHTGMPLLDVINEEVGVMEITKEGLYQPKNKELAEEMGVYRVYIFKLPKSSDMVKVAEKYNLDPNIEYAEPDWRLYPAKDSFDLGVPNPPKFNR